MSAKNRRRLQRVVGSGVALLALAWWLNATGGSDPEPAATLRSGAVERVVDGDTLRVVLDNGDRITLRLLGIDAPESGQDGGAEAREFVVARVCGAQAQISWRVHGEDRYGRTVASVEVSGKDLGVLLVHNGLAWRIKRYLEAAPAELRDAYEEAWRTARANRVGMWVGDPQPPWEWRRTNRPAKGQGIDCADHR